MSDHRVILELTAYSRQLTVGVFRGHLSAYCLLQSATALPSFGPDAGILSCGLRRLNGLGFE